MLALFAILPVFLCAVLDERASDRGAGGIKCKYLINRDANLIIRQEAKVVDAECASLTPFVQMRVVYGGMAVRLSPFAESEAVVKAGA